MMADSLFESENLPKQSWRKRYASLLWQLLSERIQCYTMGESSSVPLETAEELARSLVFSLGKVLRANAPPESTDASALLRLSWEKIERKIAVGQMLLRRAVQMRPGVPNRALDDTLKELTRFFQRYDFRFFAHRIPCAIDYQLLCPVPEGLEGIDYVNVYLRRLDAELSVLHALGADVACAVLARISPHADEDLMNPLEPVLDGALGKALLGLPLYTLCLDDSERAALAGQLCAMPLSTLTRTLQATVNVICDEIGLRRKFERAYLAQAVTAAAPSFGAAAARGDLRVLFPPACELPAAAQMFIDGPAMENTRLRALLRETASCRFVSDKIALFCRSVHSLRDADEMLSFCFWGAEQDALFDALDAGVLQLLRRLAMQKRRETPVRLSETGWETRLEQRLPYASDERS